MAIKLLLFFILIFFGCFEQLHAQNNQQIDSLKREILNLKVDLEGTQANLRLSHKRFKQGIFTSAIGYSIVIAGGILLGTDNLNEWGQPLIFAGGVVGFAGAIMLYNSNKYIGLAGGAVPVNKAPHPKDISHR